MFLNIFLSNDALVANMIVLLLGQEPGVLIGCYFGALDTPKGTGNGPFFIFYKLFIFPDLLHNIFLGGLTSEQLLQC